MLKKIQRFYILSLKNDQPELSYWLVYDRKQREEERRFDSLGAAQIYCREQNAIAAINAALDSE